MKTQDYLNKVAYVSNIGEPELSKIYKSKFDNSYITQVGMEDNIRFLANREITEKLTHGVGYSPKKQKWYGWSHRAIYGFKIGSTCKKGDCHYFAKNEKDEIEAAIAFWSDDGHKNVKAEKVKDGLIRVSWEYCDTIQNKKLHGQISDVGWSYDPNFGHGEWTAETMDDAKQMAIDFNKGVS